MLRTSPKNTRWRDSYGKAWGFCLTLAVLAHVALFFYLPGVIPDRLHEALIPSPNVFGIEAGAASDMEVLSLSSSPVREPQVTPPPEPEPEEEVVQPVPAEVPVEMTIAEVEAAATTGEGSESEGVPGGDEGGEPAPGGGGFSAPRPLHLVWPRIPGGVDEDEARDRSVHLLVHVLPDGTVDEARVEKGSRIAALDRAALSAARQARYIPAQRDGTAIAQWTRAEIRFR